MKLMPEKPRTLVPGSEGNSVLATYEKTDSFPGRDVQP